MQVLQRGIREDQAGRGMLLIAFVVTLLGEIFSAHD
jgi:hypothetical protein